MDTYGRLCTQFYDLSKPEAPPDALEFYLRHCQGTKGPVLEPMCGSGRFLIPFLEREIDIDGADASAHMLQACHRRCERRGLEPRLYQQPLRELDLPRRYGYIFIPAGSFGLVTDSSAATESLHRLHRHLLPGGRLALEVHTPRAAPEAPGEWHQWRLTRSDGAELVFSALPTYDAKEQLQRDTHCYEVRRNGLVVEREIEHLWLRLYEPDQFRRLLESAGFADITITAAYSSAAPKEEDGSVVFLCRRPLGIP